MYTSFKGGGSLRKFLIKHLPNHTTKEMRIPQTLVRYNYWNSDLQCFHVSVLIGLQFTLEGTTIQSYLLTYKELHSFAEPQCLSMMQGTRTIIA